MWTATSVRRHITEIANCTYCKVIHTNLRFFGSNSHQCYCFAFQEEKQKAYKREKRKERKRKAGDADLDGQDMDPDMAALMGFSGFGTSKK